MYHPTWNKNDIKTVFWWDVVWCSIHDEFSRYTMPNLFRALRNLFPIGNYDCSYFGIHHTPNSGFKEKNILYLIKRSKKTHFKEDVLSEMSQFINACLSGTDIKYVFYGSLDVEKTYGFKTTPNERWSARRKSAILYDKEKEALMVNSDWKLLKDNFDVHYIHTDRIWDKKECKTRDYYASGWLFEIPSKISKSDAEKIFTKIREKRLEEMHIKIS